MMFLGGARLCRISNMAIYRALGIENIRHRRKARPSVLMRRLMSLDFVLKHPGLNWLPTEAEKVEFFEGLGVRSRLLPRRIYYGDDGAKKRLLCAQAPHRRGGADTVTFAYVDPGRESTGEINTWGAAHVPLWDAIRAKGIRVHVVAIAAEHETVLRADQVLQAWAAAPGKDATKTIATPQKTGFLAASRRRAMWHAYARLSGGRYRRYLSLREGSETGQIGAPLPFPSRQMIPDRSSPVRFAASRPGPLRPIAVPAQLGENALQACKLAVGRQPTDAFEQVSYIGLLLGGEGLAVQRRHLVGIHHIVCGFIVRRVFVQTHRLRPAVIGHGIEMVLKRIV